VPVSGAQAATDSAISISAANRVNVICTPAMYHREAHCA
jgi:hypothetical protein